MKISVRTVVTKDDYPTGEISYWFWCPGCDHNHRITNAWDFNDDVDKPTFSPSILCHGVERAGIPNCHSFINDGMIQFLDDCTHHLAGQTVSLPDWKD